MIKSCTTSMFHFSLTEKQFNFVVTGVDAHQPLSKIPEDLARVKDKLLRTSKIDKEHKSMKCLLNATDFSILFMILIDIGMLNAINVPVDYFTRCAKDPNIKSWVNQTKKV